MYAGLAWHTCACSVATRSSSKSAMSSSMSRRRPLLCQMGRHQQVLADSNTCMVRDGVVNI